MRNFSLKSNAAFLIGTITILLLTGCVSTGDLSTDLSTNDMTAEEPAGVSSLDRNGEASESVEVPAPAIEERTPPAGPRFSEEPVPVPEPLEPERTALPERTVASTFQRAVPKISHLPDVPEEWNRQDGEEQDRAAVAVEVVTAEAEPVTPEPVETDTARRAGRETEEVVKVVDEGENPQGIRPSVPPRNASMESREEPIEELQSPMSESPLSEPVITELPEENYSPSIPIEPVETVSVAGATEGESVEITLPKMGWVFLGTVGGEKVDYLRREMKGDSVTFYLRPQEPGELELRFDGQDLSTGRRALHVVQLTVDEAPPPVYEPPLRVIQSVSTGQSVSAGVESIAAEQGVPSSPESTENAPRTREDLEVLADEYAQNGEVEHERDVLALLLERGNPEYDRLLFHLAQLYEEQPGRDLERAKELYQRVRDEYPFSRYWEEARRRIAYLDRHFFDIR